MASNRATASLKFESRSKFLATDIRCVFISHQKADREAAKKIADFLLGLDIDVYFDEYDSNLKFKYQEQNPKFVTRAILDGINNSSHMLVVVSPNTLSSKWVPFEIGYGYEKTDLKVLCLKGIPVGTLPEYLRAVDVVRDIDDLNNVATFLSRKNKQMLLETRMMSTPTGAYNPLSSVMDGEVNDPY
jgi:hypothetical protein